MLIVADVFEGDLGVEAEVDLVVGRHAAKPGGLGAGPHRLHRVELGRVRRQQVRVHSPELPKHRHHFRRLVHLEPVPYQFDRPRHRAAQGTHIFGARRTVDGVRVEPEVLAHVPPRPRRDRQGADGGDFLPAATTDLDHRRLADQAPCRGRQRARLEPRFIDEYQRRTAPPRFFSIRGNSSRTNFWTASSSRSRARTAGF